MIHAAPRLRLRSSIRALQFARAVKAVRRARTRLTAKEHNENIQTPPSTQNFIVSGRAWIDRPTAHLRNQHEAPAPFRVNRSRAHSEASMCRGSQGHIIMLDNKGTKGMRV